MKDDGDGRGERSTTESDEAVTIVTSRSKGSCPIAEAKSVGTKETRAHQRIAGIKLRIAGQGSTRGLPGPVGVDLRLVVSMAGCDPPDAHIHMMNGCRATKCFHRSSSTPLLQKVQDRSCMGRRRALIVQSAHRKNFRLCPALAGPWRDSLPPSTGQ